MGRKAARRRECKTVHSQGYKIVNSRARRETRKPAIRRTAARAIPKARGLRVVALRVVVAQGGNPQGRGPQGGSPQAGESAERKPSGPGRRSSRAGLDSPQAQRPNAQQPRRSATPAADTRRKDARPAQPARGAVGSEANGRTGRRCDREASGRGAQEFQRAERPAKSRLQPTRTGGAAAARGGGGPQAFRSCCSSTAAWRPATRWSRKWRHGAAEAGVESAAAESAGTGNQQQPPIRRPVKRPARSHPPSLVPRLRVAQPVPVRPLRARKPRARYRSGIRLRLHHPSSRSSLDWGLGRRPSRWRATLPLHPYSRHRRHRPQPLSRRANSPRRPSR